MSHESKASVIKRSYQNLIEFGFASCRRIYSDGHWRTTNSELQTSRIAEAANWSCQIYIPSLRIKYVQEFIESENFLEVASNPVTVGPRLIQMPRQVTVCMSRHVWLQREWLFRF